MFKRLCRKLFCLLNVSRKIIINLFFFTFLALFIVVLNQEEETIGVPDNAALMLNLKGDVVEQKTHINPADAFMSEALNQQEDKPEVLLSDIIKAINHAANDDRITTLILQLYKLNRVGLTKMEDITKAITHFKSTGKKVIAIGTEFSQDEYYIASFADEIWMDPKGWLLLDGYGRYTLYFKSALEKLKVSPHIFRVGTYKSAVEPYLRDDMSQEARKANQLWLNDLWQQYKTVVANQRGFSIANFDETLIDLKTKLEKSNGSIAEYALDNKWVDKLITRHEAKKALVDIVGENKKGKYNRIVFKDYLAAITPVIPADKVPGDKVAIIVAKGTILNGTQKPGNIGGASTAKLLRKARKNKDVKAVVLRVDSPGGSAFASEQIRREVELLKEKGKPVIASMGSYAASGGYWISVSADKIIASPSTITGSIGIFGLFMTFENSLGYLGVNTDGVGTTELAGFGVTRPLSKNMGDIFQISIERGYKDFIGLVADNRNMTLSEVDSIAQGRVWSGRKAKELGLVDELGDLDKAIKIAAEMSGLEQYDTLLIEKEMSSKDILLKKLLSKTSIVMGIQDQGITANSDIAPIMKHLQKSLIQFNQFNDPQGIYAQCIACEIN